MSNPSVRITILQNLSDDRVNGISMSLDSQLHRLMGEGCNCKWLSVIVGSDSIGDIFGYYNEELNMLAVSSESDSKRSAQYYSETAPEMYSALPRFNLKTFALAAVA